MKIKSEDEDDGSWMDNPPQSIKDKAKLIASHKNLLKSPGKKGKFLQRLLKELNAYYQDAIFRAKQQNPLAHIIPSYEQSLILNSWVYGFPFIGIYCANRIGKTFATFLNVQLWIFPNNPAYTIFLPFRVGDPRLDPANADNPNKGKLVKVLPRPSIDALDAIIDLSQSYLTHPAAQLFDPETNEHYSPPPPDPKQPLDYPPNARYLQWLQTQLALPPHRTSLESVYPDPPWNRGGTIWFGAPDHQHHKGIMFPLWKQMLPSSSIERWAPSEQEITIKVQTSTGRSTYWNLIGKSYESEDTKWSSGAVDMILLTEGVTPNIFREVKLRFKDPAIGSHDFTPYEAANVGAASHLAKRIFENKEVLPLRSYVFTEFSVRTVPLHIMSRKKREGIIKSYENDPEGQARIEGKFYTSSALVLSSLDPDVNLIKNLSEQEMFERFPNGRIYRGLDPGLDHPTACAWGYLLPSNVWIIYRIFSAPSLTIPQRCAKIVALSNNKLVKKRWGPGPQDFYLIESHSSPDSEIVCATATDYHIFKKDENTGFCYATNYQVSGLNVIESTHMRPEQRALSFDSGLSISQFIPHPLTNKPPSPRIFFLQYGEGILTAINKWQEMYWDRIRTGDNKGQPKDTVPVHGDDELDASCYVTEANFRWTKYQPERILQSDSEPEPSLVSASKTIVKINADNAAFATDAKCNQLPPSEQTSKIGKFNKSKNPYAGEVVIFGENATYGQIGIEEEDQI